MPKTPDDSPRRRRAPLQRFGVDCTIGAMLVSVIRAR
jgi:hypothetical protein